MAYPMGGGGDGGAGDARREEMQRQARIKDGTARINTVFDGGFTPDFYNNQAAAYEGYALPELERQFNRAGNDATYALANRGQLRSSTRNTMGATLDVEKARKQREVADTGMARANELRGNVEDQRSRLISQVIASGDPSNATQAAIAAAGQFQTPSQATGLGQFFNDWSNIWLTKKADTETRDAFNSGMRAWGKLGSGGSSYTVEGR